eukprot:SAG11_NODE_12187_length_717_cov_0.690939_1_plen_48_part_10
MLIKVQLQAQRAVTQEGQKETENSGQDLTRTTSGWVLLLQIWRRNGLA